MNDKMEDKLQCGGNMQIFRIISFVSNPENPLTRHNTIPTHGGGQQINTRKWKREKGKIHEIIKRTTAVK